MRKETSQSRSEVGCLCCNSLLLYDVWVVTLNFWCFVISPMLTPENITIKFFFLYLFFICNFMINFHKLMRNLLVWDNQQKNRSYTNGIKVPYIKDSSKLHCQARREQIWDHLHAFQTKTLKKTNTKKETSPNFTALKIYFNRIYLWLIYKTEHRHNILCKQHHKYCEMTNKRHTAMQSGRFYSAGFVTVNQEVLWKGSKV